MKDSAIDEIEKLVRLATKPSPRGMGFVLDEEHYAGMVAIVNLTAGKGM